MDYYWIWMENYNNNKKTISKIINPVVLVAVLNLNTDISIYILINEIVLKLYFNLSLIRFMLMQWGCGFSFSYIPEHTIT